MSQPHISAQKNNSFCQVVYACHGSVIWVKVPGVPVHKRGIRGKVKGFSKASRSRLMSTCHLIRRDSLPLFVTLTYPGEYPSSSDEWKRHLDNLARALGRVGCGRLGILWKLECQKRGAPHYHLLVWGVRNIRSFRLWLAETWYRIVGSGDPRHLRAGTSVERIKSHRSVMSYVAKYMSKLEDGDGWDSPGRFWGIINRKAIPWAEILTADVTRVFANRLKRWLRRATGFKYISHFGQKFYLDAPEAWFLRLDEQFALSP